MNDNKNVGARFIEPAVSLPKRKDIRLKSYDYKSNGYYFITICAKQKKIYRKL
jgi:hypothetical protein